MNNAQRLALSQSQKLNDEVIMADVGSATLASSFLSLQAFGHLSLLQPMSYQGTSGISTLFSFTVQCAIPDKNLQTMRAQQKNRLYQPITLITAQAQDGIQQYVNGLVTAIDLSLDNATCTLTIEPALSLLKKSRRNRIFLNKTPVDIVHQILQETLMPSYPNFQWDANKSTIRSLPLNTKNAMTMQYQESDFAFISRLLHQIGVYYYFSFDHQSHTMHWVTRVSQLKALPSLVLCDAHTDRKNANIYDWKSVSKISADTVVLDTYDFTQADANLRYDQAKPSDLATYTFPSAHQTLDQAAALANQDQHEMQSNSHYFRAKTGRLDIQVGMLVSISPTQTQKNKAQDYVITSLQSQAHAQGQNTYHCELSATLAHDHPYQPPCTYQKPLIFSLQTAVVIATGTAPVMTNNSGQVKVRFMWDDENTQADTCAWIRVIQPSAGKNAGMAWAPSAGEEVLVSFENGDIDHPVIVGSAYNSTHPPAFDVAHDYATTAIKMASLSKDTIDSARSNELIFTNHLYEETITLKAQRDYTQMIQNDAITGVNGRSQTSVLQGNMSITIAQGALLAKAAKTITLQVGNTKLLIAPSGISLEATSIHINPASSGSAIPSQIIHQTLTRDDAQTKIDNAMQTDVGASKAASSKSNHEWEIKALAASMIIAIPFDTIFAGEVEQAAAGAEITSLEIEDLAADVASDEASSLETEDLGEETAEDLSGEPSEDLGADAASDAASSLVTEDLGTDEIAKRTLAKEIYIKSGYDTVKIDDHIKGIDFTRPVEKIVFDTKKIIQQIGKPGLKGDYFSEPGESASRLGISEKYLDRNNTIQIKSIKKFLVNAPTEALKSTSKMTMDTWSIPGEIIKTEGGGTQYFIPNSDNITEIK